ncbi:MAG: hypothetical protein B6U72_06250, partial [Candidatus Altiarchaeales archaeon ex4484_2]
EYGFSLEYPSTWQIEWKNLSAYDNKFKKSEWDLSNLTVLFFKGPKKDDRVIVSVLLYTNYYLSKNFTLSDELINKSVNQFFTNIKNSSNAKVRVLKITAEETNNNKRHIADLILEYDVIKTKHKIVYLNCNNNLFSIDCSSILESYDDYEPVFSRMIDSLRCEVPLLESLNLEGRWLLQERRYDEALEKYDELLELEPESVTALNNKGIALRGLHKYEEALEVYDTALTLEPDDTRVLYNKADVLTDLGRYSEAIGLLDKVLEKNSSYSDAWMNKAVNLHFLGRYNEALYAYDNVLEDSSRYDREDILLNKIDALNGLGRYDEAITLADEAIEIDPNFDSAWHNKGLTLYYLGYLNRSLECFNKVLELNPSAKDAAANREFIIELMENQTSTT